MRRPKRVLHILSGATGGAAMSAIGLMRALEREGISSCAVSADFGDDTTRAQLAEATRGAVAYMPLYWWNKKNRVKAWKRPILELLQIARTGWARGSALRVAEFARRERADLIHSANLLTPEGGMAARLLSLPHVWHVREMVGAGQPFRFPLEGPSLGELLQRRASKVVANSPASARCIASWLPPGLLEVVPNGIDLSRYVPRAASPGPELVVAMVGSLSSRSKKHALFVEAASLVARQLPLEFRIYGDDPSSQGRADSYSAELHSLAAARLGDRLKFMGYVPDPARIMSEIDLLVQPADGDSFGRVVVEAMAAALPVVGARGGGSGEIVADGETGLLAPPDDAGTFALLIERFARDFELRKKMGSAGRARAERYYSIEACAAGILRVYEAAMERPLSLLPPIGARAGAWS